jgi:hypothetical protein
MATDPLSPVIGALSLLVAPNPTLNTATPQNPSAWVGPSPPPPAATQESLYSAIQPLLGALFAVSSDMTTVGQGVNKALTDVAKVVATLATTLATVTGDVGSAMSGLQQGLAMAQTLAPGSASVVLTSASSLFKTLQDLLSSVSSVDEAAAELAELSQQLTALAGLFPS